jgi:pimeloyl-ACP methyl ester carboxylesterase
MPAEPAAPFEVAAGGVAIRGEREGQGPPVVLCHGITATRRQVLHGSRALARGGHSVISYDARGHGESDPAPAGERAPLGGGYVYPELVADLEAVVADRVGEGDFALAGHSMGAHTAVAYALAHPERVATLVVVGPVYDGSISDASLEYWDGLADALQAGGVDAFVDYVVRVQGSDPAWRDSVRRFTRARMEAHRHLDAVADALREVPRSRPFDSLADLEGLEVPALVVASGDVADPGHPYATAAEYARRLPRAELVSEAEGQSPLAWQGGRLSREIARFCAANWPKAQE